ncbi:MAG TPA: hypothetical protein DEO84_12075, partial [candidate division Zixibacteria bacterium]|nr:hypothetical protein [candidate division Zixibacteria bacterium]
MQKVSRFLIFCLIISGFAAVSFAGQYSSDFPQYLAKHQGAEKVAAIITMADQVDLRALQDELSAQHADRQTWHETVVRTLQQKATESQADLFAVLANLTQSGQVESYQSMWLGNLVLINATPDALDRLVSRNDITQICPDYPVENVGTVPGQNDSIPVITGHEIGANRIHAPECWAMGITGEGRLVSHIDTGVSGSHPAYSARWRGVADARYTGHPGWAWFDPITNTTFPFDSGQHGTHTMGTICGRSTTTPDTVGIAIDAQWISAGVIDRGGIEPTISNALLSMQWVADPDEDPATVWDVPDVCSNSWGIPLGYRPACDETFWDALDAAEAATVVFVFAAGNEGPTARSLRTPGDRATTDYECFSVGAVTGSSPSLPIADFSSRGPSNCTPTGMDAIKPEVVAPGVEVRSSVPGNGYESSGWSGTSMATPHVAGVVALMRQANPNITVEQVKSILLGTAGDLGPTGNDNAYGMGVVNAYAAVQQAFSLLSGWGVLSGTVTDLGTGSPIQGARITVAGRPWGTSSRINGTYFLYAPADTNWQIQVDFPPVHFPASDTVTLAAGDTVIRDFALEGQVPVKLKASFSVPN